MTGWIHRIDAIPKLGTNVRFKLNHSNLERFGTVLPASVAEQERFRGIGAEVVYQSNGRRYLSNEVAYWRYDR